MATESLYQGKCTVTTTSVKNIKTKKHGVNNMSSF